MGLVIRTHGLWQPDPVSTAKGNPEQTAVCVRGVIKVRRNLVATPSDVRESGISSGFRRLGLACLVFAKPPPGGTEDCSGEPVVLGWTSDLHWFVMFLGLVPAK